MLVRQGEAGRFACLRPMESLVGLTRIVHPRSSGCGEVSGYRVERREVKLGVTWASLEVIRR